MMISKHNCQASENAQKKAKTEYFSKNPSFEKWLDDVAESIISNPRYQEHWPNYTKQEILHEAEDKCVRGMLEQYYKEQDMPETIASEWDIITM